MQEEENSPLFTQLTPEESEAVSGGSSRVQFDLDTYFYILGAAIEFGNPGLTRDEVQFAWENSFIFKDSSHREKSTPKSTDINQ
ncbi:hypothetical protein BZZ01_01300 [Nostocales cyanobacterium HT-58-2]|nr:hypothetical protein BZZ01_01300 [Nostocales cyanobacterium HT-58-2]